MNDAYLAVWNTIPPNRPALLRAYLCRIVRNLSIKKYRVNTAEKRNSFYDRSLEELAECIPARETVENQWDAKELGKQLDTTATLTEVTISPVSITLCFQGKGLIGQCQRYPNGTNITDPTIVLYDREGNVMQMETRYAPFGSRAGSGDNNTTGELRIVQGYETFIDLDALDHIEICGVDIQIGQ